LREATRRETLVRLGERVAKRLTTLRTVQVPHVAPGLARGIAIWASLGNLRGVSLAIPRH